MKYAVVSVAFFIAFSILAVVLKEVLPRGILPSPFISEKEIIEDFEDAARVFNSRGRFETNMRNTFFSSASVGPGPILTLNFIIDSVSEPSLLGGDEADQRIREIRKGWITNDGCSDEDMVKVMDNGAKFKYVYRTRKGAVFMDITLDREVCNNWYKSQNS